MGTAPFCSPAFCGLGLRRGSPRLLQKPELFRAGGGGWGGLLRWNEALLGEGAAQEPRRTGQVMDEVQPRSQEEVVARLGRSTDPILSARFSVLNLGSPGTRLLETRSSF